MKSNIHVVMFSSDRNIFEESSSVRVRMEHFGTLADGIDIIVFGANFGPKTLALKNGVIVHRLSGGKFAALFKAPFIARKLSKPRTVIVAQDPFEIGLLALMASWVARRPLHVQVHIDFMSPHFRNESLRQRIQAVIAVYILARAKSIRAVSGKIAAYVNGEIGVSARKIVIAPIYVDQKEVNAKPTTVNLKEKFPQFEWTVLLASRFVKQKNIPLAVEAFELFKKAHPKTGLIIIGTGPEEAAIRREIASRGLDASVKIGPWPRDFSSCMRTSDVFLLSSDYEGWGMTVIEAAALGKPIIMTDVGCAGEFLIHEKNGLVVPTRDRRALVEALERYYSNRSFAKNMAENAARDAASYMSSEENDRLTVKAWESAL